MDHIEVNERGNDLFWSDQAKRYFPEFKVASLEQGLAFAFEMEPRRCLERTGGRMPFGCHASAATTADSGRNFIEGRVLT